MNRLLAFVLLMPIVSPAAEPFRVVVLDESTDRGVPLVELETVHHRTFVTDSAGVAAIDQPELFGQRCFFWVRSHGYEMAADGFGFRGVRLDIAPGGSATVKIKRLNVAERLYRTTGGGIYAESVQFGDKPPIERPLLNAGVIGQDSVQTTLYRGKLFWMWGDTILPGYPLGIYHMTGATSLLPRDGGLDPNLGVNLHYFTKEDGTAKPIAEMPGDGPTWLAGPFVLKNDDGDERMYAGYTKIKPPLTAYRHGLCRWNDETETFRNVVVFPEDAPLLPIGHATIRETSDGRHVYFSGPFPLVRVPATAGAVVDSGQYEGFTCLVEGGRLDRPKIDRADDGTIRWGWKRNTAAVGAKDVAKLVKDGILKPQESWMQLRDRDTGKTVIAHTGTVSWNAFRKRWVMIAVEIGGTSLLGEVWYAEAATPLGPWVYATKIVTHDKYSFYNVKHHDYFDTDGGRTLYFEGTYTKEFSGTDEPTPRYDYNQIMYRLDLDDTRTKLPVPVHLGAEADTVKVSDAGSSLAEWASIDFFAGDEPGVDTIPVGRRDGQLIAGDREPLFHAIALDAESPPTATVPLFVYVNDSTGEFIYSTETDPPRDGFARQKEPLCRVWPNPYAAK